MTAANNGASKPRSRLGMMARKVFLAIAPFAIIAGVWQFAALFFPPYLFPSLIDVFWRCVDIFGNWSELSDVLSTAGRILFGLVGAFVIGCIFAFLIVQSKLVDKLLSPVLIFFQGIPALSWVVFAIIWFHGAEFRILFIMIMTTLPAFTFQVVGALRGMSKDHIEMVMSFRPSRVQFFRTMILPAILPDLITSWKVNLGNASRVVVVAELVGASGGVGYQLLQQQQLFDMAGALAWTLMLVFFVLIVQWILTLIETAAFQYRATSERTL